MRPTLSLLITLACLSLLNVDSFAADADKARRDPPRLEVREDAPEGHIVGRLPIGKATLSKKSLSTINRKTPFGVDPDTGELFVRRAGLLDHEDRGWIDLNLDILAEKPSDAMRDRFLNNLRHSGAADDSLEPLSRKQQRVEVRVWVTNANEPPELLAAPRLAVAADDDDAGTIPDQVTARDPDQDDVLRYSLAENAAGLTIDPVSGRLSLTDAPATIEDTELQVEVTVTDAGGLTDSQRVTVLLPAAVPAEDVPAPTEHPEVAELAQVAPVPTTDLPEPVSPVVPTPTDATSTDIAPVATAEISATPSPEDPSSDTVSPDAASPVNDSDSTPLLPTFAPSAPVPAAVTELEPLAAPEPAALPAPVGEEPVTSAEAPAAVVPPAALAVEPPAAAAPPVAAAPIAGLTRTQLWFLLATGLVTLVVLVQVFVPAKPGDLWEQPGDPQPEQDEPADHHPQPETPAAETVASPRTSEPQDLADPLEDQFEICDTDEDTAEMVVTTDNEPAPADGAPLAPAAMLSAMSHESAGTTERERAIHITEVVSRVLSTLDDPDLRELELPASAHNRAERTDSESVESVDDWLQRVLGRSGSPAAALLKTQTRPASQAPSTTAVLTCDTEDEPEAPAATTPPALSANASRTERNRLTPQQERERMARFREVAKESARGHIAVAEHERFQALRIVVGAVIPVCLVSGFVVLSTQALGPKSEGLGMALVGTGVALFGLYTSRSRSLKWRLDQKQALPAVEDRDT